MYKLLQIKGALCSFEKSVLVRGERSSLTDFFFKCLNKQSLFIFMTE